MLLAVDTSTRSIGVALYNGDWVLSESTWISKSHHTVELAPAVTETLLHVGADKTALKALGVAIGPGSFTGLRIGLALAKGLCLSHRLPLIGIPTMDVIAAAQPVEPDFELATVLEAGRRRLAIGWYHVQGGKWQSKDDLHNMTVEEFVESITEPVIVCGELNGEARQLLCDKGVVLPSPAQCVRRPGVLAELAWKRWQAGKIDNPATLKPIYLHHGEPIPG